MEGELLSIFQLLYPIQYMLEVRALPVNPAAPVTFPKLVIITEGIHRKDSD
jgi:hypothetical protein